MTTRGTTNRNDRGNTVDRARRRAWVLSAFQEPDRPGWCRCYRCGKLLNASTLTIDRIVPACLGGRYVRGNIRPACGPCNSQTGGALAHA